MDIAALSGLTLAAAMPDGRLGPPRARVRSLAGFAGEAALVGSGPEVLAATDLADATEAALAQAVRAGIRGVLLVDNGGWPAVEQLGARLSVVEATCSLVHGRIGVLSLATSSAGVLKRLPPPPVSARLLAVGVDIAALAAAPDGPAAITARGLTLMSAAACGVPAFETIPVAGSQMQVAGAAAAGFAWVLARQAPDRA
jgi:hypothetical protein